jgi:branched chain amino acid efflux pump
MTAAAYPSISREASVTHVLLPVIIIAGVGTYLTRALSLILGSHVALPGWLEQWLSFVTPAVLGALLAPTLFLRDGTWAITWHNPALLAALPTGVTAWLSRNLLLTICAGVLFFALARALV